MQDGWEAHRPAPARELSQSVALLGLAGSSIGAVIVMVMLAAQAFGR